MVKRVKKNNSRSFTPGWHRATEDLPRKAYLAIRTQIMETLGLTSDTAWRKRMTGDSACSQAEYQFIERLFHQNGITEVFGPDNKIIPLRGYQGETH